MPLILDNILVFLWRLIAHWVRSFRCRKWPVVIGKIDNIDSPTREMYPYTEIHFLYRVSGEGYDNRCLRGFWYTDSANRLAKRYRKLKSLAVRYAPNNPTKSYLMDDDQKFTD